MTFTTTTNPEQLRAITTTDGLLLIIAGPGSGKTFPLRQGAKDTKVFLACLVPWREIKRMGL